MAVPYFKDIFSFTSKEIQTGAVNFRFMINVLYKLQYIQYHFFWECYHLYLGNRRNEFIIAVKSNNSSKKDYFFLRGEVVVSNKLLQLLG